MFSWLHDHRRRALLDTPFPAAWTECLHANVGYYALLTGPEQAKLRDDLRILVAEKNWEGCGGLVMTDEIQVTVAAQACLLLLGWEHAEFAGVESILVYPTGYVAREPERLWGSWNSVITEGSSARLGQATDSGTVILSWGDALTGGRHPAQNDNVVLHEFAHLLDFQAGSADGVPHLRDNAQRATWAEVMTAEYDALVRAVQEGHPTLLRAYGATNAAEFFAVATECFFASPVPLHDTHPRLYAVLQDFYQQDPASRFGRTP